MEPAEVIDLIKRKARKEGRVMVDGTDYPYAVVDPSLEQRLPNFVGVYKGMFFISEEIPEDYRVYMIRHEVRCLTNRGQCGHCVQALQRELAEVPEEIKIAYIAFRTQHFRDVIAFHEKHDKNEDLEDFLAEMRRSLEYLESDAL